MISSRLEVHRKYKPHGFVMPKDHRPMDDICHPKSGFKLQAQQLFMQRYLQDTFDTFKHMLLYHALGSGKSCTAITMAEQFLCFNPKGNVKVILPARLRTNFYDELMSDCASEKYMTQDERSQFQSSNTPSKTKAKIRSKFMEAVHKNYTVMSFEALRKEAIAASSLQEWVKEFTRDTFIIIDEVHNLVSQNSHPSVYQEILQHDNLTFKPKIAAIYTHLFRLLVERAHSSCKSIFLTATPIFDNIRNFAELASILNPEFKPNMKRTSIEECVDALRGFVSYFPGTSAAAYPKKEYIEEEVPLTSEVDKILWKIHVKEIINEKDLYSIDNENLDAFMSKERRAGLACMPGRNPLIYTKPSIQKLVSTPINVARYAPKLARLSHNLDAPGKHIIYTSFVEAGVRIITSYLESLGYVNIAQVIRKPNDHKDYKVFAAWDGSTDDVTKQAIKNTANSVSNLDGKFLRIVIGSPSIKEGVSFKHVQHMHLLDPVWNFATKEQVEGRAIRFCSHVDIPKDHPTLKREVKVHTYVLKPTSTSSMMRTADQIVYHVIIPHKYERVKVAERGLKRVSIDYFLFRRLHEENAHIHPTPKKRPTNTSKSPIDLEEIPKKFKPHRVPKKDKTRNTCPKKRRPNIHNECPFADMLIEPNNQGFKCCYRRRMKNQKNSCPKQRRPHPVSGECQNGFSSRPNKQGQPCCYKQQRRVHAR